MSFNISDFRSRIEKYGGVAKTNLFVVEIYDSGVTNGKPSIEPGDLRFFCKSATLPGLNLNVQDYFPNGFGVKQSIPTSMTNGGLNLVFMLDSSHRVLNFFHQWMQRVCNYDVSAGIFSQVDDQLPFEMGYKEEYTTTVSIKFYSSNLEGYYEYILYDVFPTEISPIDVSWDSNDTIATVTVNFAYSSMRVSGARAGSPTDRFARGTGLLEYINSIGAAGQMINQNLLPRSIQDAVNKFSRVKNIFDGLKSIF